MTEPDPAPPVRRSNVRRLLGPAAIVLLALAAAGPGLRSPAPVRDVALAPASSGVPQSPPSLPPSVAAAPPRTATAPSGDTAGGRTPEASGVPEAAPSDSPTPSDGTAGATNTKSAIVPGAVNRTTIDLEVRHRAKLTLRYDAATISVIAALDIRNTSGAGIDRLELNTVAARLGRIRITGVEVDGRAVAPRL